MRTKPDFTNYQPSPLIVEAEIDRILKAVWEAAARINPMLLATLNLDYEFKRLREMIRYCLTQGLLATEACEHTVNELLRSATGKQPHNKCDDPDQPDQSAR